MKKPAVRTTRSERPSVKAAKVQLRLRPDQKAVLARAARLRQPKPRHFMLAAASARREETPARVAKGQAARPVPVILLARSAVDAGEQGKGLGAGLLKDALLRAVQAADLIGCRAVLVHAKDEGAKAFYERF